MYSEAIIRVEFEISEIDILFETYELLLNNTINREPDLVEIAALATVLHSFYNGVEKIFQIIAKYVDDFIPTENKWHKELLMQMTKKTEKRNAVITPETISVLTEYMGFRHFYRHAYSFQLSWSKLKDLVLNLHDTWDIAKKDIIQFTQSL